MVKIRGKWFFCYVYTQSNLMKFVTEWIILTRSESHLIGSFEQMFSQNILINILSGVVNFLCHAKSTLNLDEHIGKKFTIKNHAYECIFRSIHWIPFKSIFTKISLLTYFFRILPFLSQLLLGLLLNLVDVMKFIWIIFKVKIWYLLNSVFRI